MYYTVRKLIAVPVTPWWSTGTSKTSGAPGCPACHPTITLEGRQSPLWPCVLLTSPCSC